MANPLVAETKDSTKAYSGVSLLESAADLKSAIESGDWASVAMGAVGTALDALSMAMDPFGAVLAAGVGWLMEHVGPLKEALNGLTGNADEIAAQSETWKNIATELGSIGEDLTGMVKADTVSWTGPAGDSYRQRADDTVTLLNTAQKGCEGASSGVKTAGEVVAAVRALVRDIIAELIGHLISWALQVVFTLGIGLTWVVPQVIGAVAKTASKIADLVKRLVTALKALVPLLKRAGDLFSDAAKALRNIKPGKAAPPPKSIDIKGNPKGLDGPKGKGGPDAPPPKTDPPPKGGDSTSPSGDKGDGTSTSGAKGGGPDAPPKSDPPPASKGPDDTPSSNGGTTPSGGGKGPDGGPKGDGGKPKDGGLSKDNNAPKENSTPIDCRPGSGDPIDMTTGRMMLAQTDVEIDGVLALVLDRSHFSGYRSGVHFGRSWASTADQRLEFGADRVDFAAEDGTLLIFPVPGADGVTPVEGPRWPLRRLGDEYLLAQPDRGRTLHFATGGAVRWLSAISDADANRIDFDRDEHGVLREVRHSAGHRIAVTTVDGRVTEFASAGVTLARFSYDDRAHLVEVVNSSGRPYRFAYDESDRITGWQDRNGWGYGFTYDELDRCVRGTGPRGFLSYTFAYDKENRVNRATDSLGHTTTYELNEEFQLVRETDPLGGVTAYEWDRHDRLLAYTDALGRVTRYGYDEQGLRTSETLPDGSVRGVRYDGRGRPAATVEPGGATWTYAYDAGGRLVAATDPAGGVRRYGYGPRGALTTFTDEEGRRTGVECDALGKPLTVLDPAGGRTAYAYDPLGRVVSITDPAGHTTNLAWTVEGELWKRVAPDGSVERFTYDGEINAVERTDAAGAVTRTDFGPFDLPVCEIAPDGSRTRFAYDTELRLVSVTNASGAQWRIDYDAAGRVVGETDFDGRVVTYVRDAAGQLLESSKGGEPTTYTWDALGRLTGKRYGDDVTTYAYDAAGRLVRAVTADADLTLTYDALGRVVAETCNGREVRSAYDRSGLRTARRTASGVESTWTYDAASAPTGLVTAGRSIRFAYDAAGREIGRVFGRTTLSQAWDANDRLVEQVLTAEGGHPLQRRAYEHRADDVLAGVDDLLAGRTDFDLDRLGRITGLRRPGGAERYAYDQAGNVTAAEWGAHPAGGVREYAGTLLQRAGEVGYRYDEHGRLTWRQQPGTEASWTFGWNGDDRLVQVRTPDGWVWRYAYDALGRRVAKRLLDPAGETAAETVFVWDGVLPAEEIVTTAGVPSRTTTWDWEQDRPVPVSVLDRRHGADGTLDERFHAVVADLVGSPAELVDEAGQLAWHSTQSLWGVGTASASPTPLRFPGQYFDAETGLHYNVNRYYEPETGRYISPDPIGLGGGTNPHAYVRNPTGWLDPVGLKGGKCKGGKANNPVLANNRPGQPVFHGNANVPVTEISDKKFVGILENLANGRGEGSRRAKELLKQMQEGRGWQQTAGIHQGGLGGAAGGADPRPHITVNVGGRGYHVHVGSSNGGLFAQDITPNPIR